MAIMISVTDLLEQRGICNAAVLRAMRETPRHLFIPEALRSMAYEDHPVSIGHGATISQPFMVAFMTQLLKCERNHRVLEIGTGSGYQAAILSQLAQHVYTVEIVPELAASARDRLRDLGYPNISVRLGDGYAGWPGEAPYDRILLTAAPAEIPDTIVQQLGPNGRCVAPVGSREEQLLMLIEKQPDGTVVQRPAGSVLFIPMIPAGQ